MQKHTGFTLLEFVLTLLLLGILLSIAIPQFRDFSKHTCVRKLQLQMLELKLTLKAQKHTNINWDMLYEPLDFTTKNCNFSKQKNGVIANIEGQKVYFVLKDLILECQYSKSAKLHNGESLCDIF